MKLENNLLRLIESEVEKNHISKSKHPKYDIYTYKYTVATVLNSFWNDATLIARGLVLDTDGNVIALPMKKFFNFDELGESEVSEIMSVPYQITEKKDGSLGVLTKYNGEYFISTQGSFISQQAKWATEYINTKYNDILDKLDCDTYTYLFEIIYPENKIVVDYGDEEDLFFITRINKETGEDELLTNELLEQMVSFGFKTVKYYSSFNNADIKELKLLNWDNAEGFVLHSSKGRAKIKFEKYLDLHRLMSNLNVKDVWRYMMRTKAVKYYALSEEMRIWFNNEERKLREKCETIEAHVKMLFTGLASQQYETRKEFAQAVMSDKECAKYKGYMFMLLDGRDIYMKILESEEPKIQQSFYKDSDEEKNFEL